MMQGAWEPHTSSVDFCEPNYLFNPYIAEVERSVVFYSISPQFHNAWSSLTFISLFAVVGYFCSNPTGELRFTLMYLIAFIIGTTLNFPSLSHATMFFAQALAALLCTRRCRGFPKARTRCQ